MAARVSLHQDVLRGTGNGRSATVQPASHIELCREPDEFPGAGKTSLLESVIPSLQTQLRVAVIEGDVCTTLDAERIARLGVRTAQDQYAQGVPPGRQDD